MSDLLHIQKSPETVTTSQGDTSTFELSTRVGQEMLSTAARNAKPSVTENNTGYLDFSSNPYKSVAGDPQSGKLDAAPDPCVTPLQEYIQQAEMKAADELIKQVPNLVAEASENGASSTTIMGVAFLNRQNPNETPRLTLPQQKVFDALQERRLNPTIEKGLFKTSPDAHFEYGWTIRANWNR